MTRPLEFSPTVMELAQLPATYPTRASSGRSTLREALTHLFFDKRRIGVTLLLGLMLTAIGAWMAPRQYVAEASLLLRLGREYIYTPEVGENQPGAPVAYDREQTLQAEASILTSRDTLQVALDGLGVQQVFPEMALSGDPAHARAAALEALSRGLGAELLKGSNLLQVSFKHADAQTSARVLAKVIDAYLAKRASVLTSGTLDTAQSEFDARKRQLEEAEERLAAFKAERGIRSFAEEQSLLLAQRNALEQRQSDSGLALAQASGRAKSLRNTLQDLKADVTLSSETQRSEAVDHARKLLLDLKLKERDLASKFSDSHLLVQDVRADIQRTTQYLRDLESRPTVSVRSGRSPARDAGESDLLRSVADERQAQAGTSTLEAQRARIDKRLAELAGSESQLRTMERERRLAEVNYEGAAKRLRDESTLADLDRKRRSNVSIVQAPMVPAEARSLRMPIIVVGSLLSLCAALGVALVSALWRDTYLLPEQLQRDIDVPLLAAIPNAQR